jgi:hypothetical protein
MLYVLAASPLQVECGHLGSTVYEVIRIRSVEPPTTVHHPDFASVVRGAKYPPNGLRVLALLCYTC